MQSRPLVNKFIYLSYYEIASNILIRQLPVLVKLWPTTPPTLSHRAPPPPFPLSKFCPPLILASFHLFHLTLSKPSIRSCQHFWSFLLCGPFTSSQVPSHPAHRAAIKEHLKNPSRLFVCLAPFHLQLPKTKNNKKKRKRPPRTRINVLHFGPSKSGGTFKMELAVTIS